MMFNLRCTNSEYPNHLVPGVVYKINTDIKDKNGEGYIIYWFHTMDRKWHQIGFFPISCFDATPIRNYIAKKKGIVVSDKPRTRPGVSKARVRPGAEKQRVRPSIQKPRSRPGG